PEPPKPEPPKPQPARAAAPEAAPPFREPPPRPEPPRPGAKSEIDPAPTLREPRLDLPPITVMARKGGRGWLRTVLLSFLGAAGVGLLCLAAVWGFQPETEQVFGVASRTASLSVGVLGIVVFGVAAYFLLDRLGAPRERRLR
ncbi:MAG: hypothetical protein ACREEW_19090, partial [Caulobacteraceae bacterium]